MKLPASLKKIDSSAFSFLENHIVILPSGISELAGNSFETCYMWENQKNKYYISKNEYLEEYMKEHGLRYKVISRPDGLIADDPVVDDVLYYVKQFNDKIKVPSGVKIIDSYAAIDNKFPVEILLPDTVKEIRDNAFINCKEISSISFGNGIEKIGSKAFPGYKNQLVDLPQTINEVASGAFGSGCLVSICGEMPGYQVKLTALEKVRKEVNEKVKSLEKLKDQKKTLESEFDEYVKNRPSEFSDIPTYQSKITEIKNRQVANQQAKKDKENSLLNQKTQKETELNDLLDQRKKCSVFAVSKKKELDECIQKKQDELQYIPEELKRQKNEFELKENAIQEELNSMRKKLEELQSDQGRWETAKSSKSTAISNIVKQTEEIKKAKSLFEAEEKALNKEYEQWAKKKEELLEKQKIKKLISEKEELLKKMGMPQIKDSFVYKNISSDSDPLEVLLNNSFLEGVTDWECEYNAIANNQFVELYDKEINRIKEINNQLGKTVEDGVSHCHILEMPPIKPDYCPKCFETVNAYFAKTTDWEFFTKSGNPIKCKKSPQKNNQDRFFSKNKYFVLNDNDEFLLLFPYCAVKYKAKEPLTVIDYSDAKIKVTYADKEETVSDIPVHGELISERYTYQNRDGSINKRYKDNPIIKTIRFTKITIKGKQESFTLPVDSYQNAVQFEDDFNSYKAIFTKGNYSKLYKTIKTCADFDQIEALIRNFEEEEKKLAEKEKKLEEKKRLAAEKEAEAQRRALIQRQKEINEERKRQAEEKKKIFSMFEEETEEETTESENGSIGSDIPIEITGNRMISNNVFKIMVSQKDDFSEEYLICYFTDLDGNVISNRKKLLNSEIGSETAIGFILKSEIDYTKMQTCLMCVESNDVIIGKIDFKMNVSFYSDF